MKNSQTHVLIVDDEPALLEVVATLFKSLGFQVETADNGKAALEIIKDHKIHVVLSDIRMQDGDGWYLAKAMKTIPNHPKILFITGFSEHTVEQVFHEGIDGFFEKPFDATAVKNAIIRTCGRPQDRWQIIPTHEVKSDIVIRAKNFEELNHTHEVYFGRGGFCFKHDNLHLPEGTPINFEVTIDSHVPFAKMRGTGVIMWRHIKPDTKMVGYGLEIEYLEQDGPDNYQKTFGKEISWIPSMNLISLAKKSSA